MLPFLFFPAGIRRIGRWRARAFSLLGRSCLSSACWNFSHMSPNGVIGSALFVTLFLCSSLLRAPKPLPTVKKQIRIMRSAPGDKVEEQLNVSVDAELFAPVFHLAPGIDAAVAFQHFHLRFFGVRRL